MIELSTSSLISLYVLLALIAVLTLVIWWVQLGVLSGNAFRNPDGSVDDWHDQKILYGISYADVFLACPASATGIALVFLSPRWGFYLLALVSFWLLWSNVMTTVTSLRFEKPKITFTWLLVYPFGSVVGLAYILWTLVHFDAIYGP